MQVLIIGDVHNKIDRVESALKAWVGPVVLIGDYFDDFDDTINDAIKTAEWLKHSLQYANRVHLMGNHDFQYMLPVTSGVWCSGYTIAKHNSIKQVLTPQDWLRVKYFHSIDNCWFSHAGITRQWFDHPIHGTTIDGIEDKINAAVQSSQARDYTQIGCIYGADYYRGGQFKKGGILWNDWRNSEHFKDITQVMGHTPVNSITVDTDESLNSTNINVDTHMHQVAILDTQNNNLQILDV